MLNPFEVIATTTNFAAIPMGSRISPVGFDQHGSEQLDLTDRATRLRAAPDVAFEFSIAPVSCSTRTVVELSAARTFSVGGRMRLIRLLFAV